MAYVIGSQKGKDIAEGLKKNETWTNPADGSKWTKQSDGSVTVTHNGQVTNNAYKSTSSGGGSSGGSTNKNNQYTTGSYTIGSDAGKKQAQGMGIGSNWIASDGSEWVKENDGTITVYHNGTKTTGAYTPTDLGILGSQQVYAGLPVEYVEKTYNDRYNKIMNDSDLLKYINDPAMQMMLNYINDQKQQEDLDKRLDIMNEGRPDAYESQYDPRIEALLNEILNREDFSDYYDVNNDPLYQQYAQMYQREGDRAMRETMAEAAAGAGGMNTYAITAAQQAQNYYGSQLNDKIPELYQLAYEMYLNEKESKVQDLGILQGMDDRQYSRYRDTMSDFYNDRNFAYGAYQDAIDQGNIDRQFSYDSMINDRNFQNENYWNNKNWDLGLEKWGVEKDQIALENSRYDVEQAEEDVWALVALGVEPDAALIAKAGLNPDTIRQAVAAAQQQIIAKNTKSSGGGSRKSGSDIDIDDTDLESEESTEPTTSFEVPDYLKDNFDMDSGPSWLADAQKFKDSVDIKNTIAEIYMSEGKGAALSALKEALAVGAINQKTYMSLYNEFNR